jgi:alkylation response protein AidB-like acyl-CoA dehydrogenase
MDFEYDDEQQALREAVRGLLARRYADFEKRRAAVAADPGFDESLWAQLAEMGVLGLPFAEADGGMGAGPVEVGIVAEELGRVLAPEPFLTSVVLAGGAVALAGTPQQRAALLGPLADGSSLAAFAHAEPGARWSGDAASVTATADGQGDRERGWTLSGVKEPVVQGGRADALVVSAALPEGGTGLFTVEGSADGVTRTAYSTHDGGRAARVAFDAAPATLLGNRTEDAAGLVAQVLDLGRLAACHEALGHLAEAITATRDYLTSRKQFGVTLNHFQALTFRAADMYVSLELTRSLVLWATMVVAARPGTHEASEAVARASLQVAKAGRHIGQEAIQLHGGIGVTAEYSVGHRLSRLTALEHQLGDQRLHLSRLAAEVAGHGEVDPLP